MGSAYGELRASKVYARDLENTADLRRVQAREAKEQGTKQAQDLVMQGRQTKGRQRTGFAGQNVRVDSGSALKIQQDTDLMVARDVERVKNAAARRAWSLNYDAKMLEDRARYERRAGYTKAFTSLLSEVSQWASLGSNSGWFSGGGSSVPTSQVTNGTSKFYGWNM